MTYRVDILPAAQDMVLKISDRRIQEKLLERMTALAADPELQGKPLGDDLAGYRSIRAVGPALPDHLSYRAVGSGGRGGGGGNSEGREPRGRLQGSGQAYPSRSAVMCVMASTGIACNIQAISAVQRPRYNDLVARLRSAMRDRRNCRTVSPMRWTPQ